MKEASYDRSGLENDGRNTDVNKYLVDPDGSEGRRKAFLGGWTRFRNQGGSDHLQEVTWVGLGMVYASVLGDISLDRKKGIYRLLLGQYLSTEKVSHWTNDEREKALRLAAEAEVEFQFLERLKIYYKAPCPGEVGSLKIFDEDDLYSVLKRGQSEHTNSN